LEILLNGKELEIEGIDADVTVLQLLESVEESLNGTGATVVEIQLDEKLVSPEEADKLEELKVVEFSRIEFVAATAQDMVRAGFEDGEAGLQHLEELALEVSADLRIGKIKEAMDVYLQFVDGIEWLVTMLKNADKAFASSMTENSLESERQGCLQHLADQMSMVQAAQENEDWVGMADILEYEFPETLGDCKVFIKKVLGS
jgi:hypothetical protein